jgi:two-component system chemotaxis response regulator CheY
MARILVVDDDAAIREMVSAVLSEESDHDVVLASNGRDALDRLMHDESVDAIVCDVNMPVMNGVELVRAVRADPELSELPVLLISAAVDPDGIDPALEVDLLLEKPFEINALLACVSFILSSVRAGGRSVRVCHRGAATSVRRIVRDAHRRPRLRGSTA